ncbi:hypothetical protein Tco_1318633 [Tanacetum coccineum]
MTSDSSGGGLSDLDDIDDLEMIMQQVQAEEEQEEEAERVRHQNYIYRERLVAEEHLMADYFGPNLKYPLYYFRKQYRCGYGGGGGRIHDDSFCNEDLVEDSS